jgi:hypothetical protein
MRTGFLTAVAIAAVAFSGVAQASVLTETFTGFINSGTDSVGAFGAAGANLAGDTVTFSFGYNTVLLQAAVNAGTDGSGDYVNPSNYNEYLDNAGDSAFTESVTINSQTFAVVSNQADAFVYGCEAAYCGGASSIFVIQAALSDSEYIETHLNTTQNYSTSDNLLSQSEVNALVGGGVTTGSLFINNGSTGDSLALSNVSTGSATPEPTTSISLTLGFGMVGLLKRRRAAR